MSAAALGRLLEVPAAAEYVGLTPKQMSRQIAARRVRVLRAGRKIRIYERWLDEFRDAHTSAPDGDSRGIAPEIAQPATVPCSLRDLMPRVRQIKVVSRRRRVNHAPETTGQPAVSHRTKRGEASRESRCR